MSSNSRPWAPVPAGSISSMKDIRPQDAVFTQPGNILLAPDLLLDLEVHRLNLALEGA